jgi:hypothetical protein
MTSTLNPAALSAVVRRFPLVGRPRPSCPSLPQRVEQIADSALAAGHDGADQLAEGAHALNKAALIASDCGLPDLARDLCWQHIDLYRAADHPLTVLQARYMLEPVINLVRLQLRAHDGDEALRLLTAIYHAVRSGTDLVIEGRTLPLTGLTGDRDERYKLHEWVWLHLIGDGVRALVLAGRWDDAVAHAQAHNGIGLRLMEGRQATVLAHLVSGDLLGAQAALAECTPQHPWQLQVAACLKVMCANPDSTPKHHDVTTMITRFAEYQPMRGYAFFRAQLGLCVATLAGTVDPDASSRVLAQVADEAIESADGYGAREVLRHHDIHAAVTEGQYSALTDLLNASGLGSGAIPEPLLRNLLDSTWLAAAELGAALRQPTKPAT